MSSAYALIHGEAGVSGVSFPDYPGAVATGRSAEEAIRKGSEGSRSMSPACWRTGSPPFNPGIESSGRPRFP